MSEIMPTGNPFWGNQTCRTLRVVSGQSSLLLYICDWPSQTCYCDNLHSIGTDAAQSTVHVYTIVCLLAQAASLHVPATVMSKATQHTRTSYSIAVISKSESRGCSTSFAGAVDQDMSRI